jgi:murein DD-endopeptidase MepM/ murein hydrolase activator NlpD
MKKIILIILLATFTACTSTNTSDVADGTDRGITVTFNNIDDGTDRFLVPKEDETVAKPKDNKDTSREKTATVQEKKDKDNIIYVAKENNETINSFLYPINNPSVKKDFDASNFGGIEFNLNSDENIYSIGPGMVIFSGVKPSLGNSIFVYHNDGYVSIYTNLEKLNFKKGDYIRDNNSIIATAKGSFKFELRKRTDKGVVPLDPEDYLKKRS